MSREKDSLYNTMKSINSKIDKFNEILEKSGLNNNATYEKTLEKGTVRRKDIKKTYYDVKEEFLKAGKKAQESGNQNDVEIIKIIIEEIDSKYKLIKLSGFNQETEQSKGLRERLQFEISNYLFHEILDKYE
jgi:hypothetical protein